VSASDKKNRVQREAVLDIALLGSVAGKVCLLPRSLCRQPRVLPERCFLFDDIGRIDVDARRRFVVRLNDADPPG
jgi:hypothetical protein